MTEAEAAALCSRVVRGCVNHEECGNMARPHKSLCHACEKRRQRHSRRRQPHFTSPWQRLVAAALRFASAEDDDEYTQAEAVLRGAALNYVLGNPKRAARMTSQATAKNCPPAV